MEGDPGGAASAGERERGTIILTPDQRVRVFVSSTIEELAAERAAARRAIEGVRLSPILFELGARPYPPRSLYRAYLEQSHVFVGIYWQRYGWVAPGMDVSGLEDEYLLAGAKPKLVYVKRPALEREERLAELLDRVRADDEVSYKTFSGAEELERLVADDLAQLLSESFMIRPVAESSRPKLALPADASTFVGRAGELAELCALLERDDVRLVTVTGSGGIGKTRLALRAAAQVTSAFDEGAVFVSLASLRDAALVPAAIGAAVGLRDTSPESTLEALRDDLADRSLLLVVDNFEHLLTAATLIPELLSGAPRVKVLATSREALRVRAEHEFPVPPLAPAAGVRLFAERAGAVRHGFHVDDDNAETVARICSRLEGVPLAIELAAARSRLLPPEALLERLDRRLDVLVGGARDLPERQRTLRATITWSYDLLDEEERQVFGCFAVFVGSFSLAAAEAVGAAVASSELLDLVASLVDKSLLRVETTAGEPRFRMLELIGEFARERLDERDETERVGERHALYYRDLSAAVGTGVRGQDQLRWLQLLSPQGDGDNLRAAIAWFLRHHRLDELADVAWALWLPAWIGGRLEEGRLIARAALASERELSARSRARLLAVAGLFDFWKGEKAEADVMLHEALDIGRSLGDEEVLALATLGASIVVDPLEGEGRAEHLAQEALELYRRLDDRWGEAAARNIMASIYVRQGRLEGNGQLFEEALSSAIAVGDAHLAVMAEVCLAAYLLDRGDVDGAAMLLASSVRRQRSIRLMYSMLYLLDGAARLARHRGNDELATLLLGAASRQRQSMGAWDWGNRFGRRDRLIEDLRTTLTPPVFTETFEKGAALGYSGALDAATRATEATGAT